MTKRDTPLRDIRRKCLDCAGGLPKEVRLCRAFDCPLWNWRFGKRPETVAKNHPELMERESVMRLGDEDTGRQLTRENGSR